MSRNLWKEIARTKNQFTFVDKERKFNSIIIYKKVKGEIILSLSIDFLFLFKRKRKSI